MDNYIIPVILAIIASGPGVWSIVSQLNKIKVDAAAEINRAAIALIRPYQDRISELEKRVATLETELQFHKDNRQFYEEAFTIAARLYNQLRSHDLTPVCELPERRK